MERTYRVLFEVTVDETDTDLDLNAVKGQVAQHLHNLYGEQAWLPDEPALTRVRIDYRTYHPSTGEFVDEIDSDLSSEEVELIEKGQVIQAIKEVRGRTSLGLGEAKHIVDRYIAKRWPGGRPR